MSKFVEGSYVSIEDAQRAINNLISQGYSKKDITLVANESVEDSVTTETDVDVSSNYDAATDSDDDRSMWQKIKDAFTVDTYDQTASDDPSYRQDEGLLHDYKDDIAKGNIIVLVDGEVDEMNATSPNAAAPVIDPTGTTVTPPTPLNDESVGATTEPVPEPTDRPVEPTEKTMDDSERISLQEERLNVDTNEVKSGEVNIKKKVTEETQTVDVPVKHEEVTIEKRPVAGKEGTETTLGDEEEIKIPITEEQVEVTKKPVVTDEIVVNKETKEDVESVSDTVRKEDIDVDTEGDVSVNEDEDIDRRI